MRTYKITEEQIKSIAEGGGKKKIKEMFPQVFETKLEVGKWYLVDGNKCGNPSRILVANFSGTEKDNNYGLTFLGLWDTEISLYHKDLGFDTRLATSEEVEAALIAEAKKRGFDIGVKIKRDFDDDLEDVIINNIEFRRDPNFFYSHKDNYLEIYGFVIYSKGQWAEIIKETPEEFVKSLFPPISEMTVKEDLEKYPNSLFWFHGDTFILEIEKTDDKLITWVKYIEIWNLISEKNNWNYDQSQDFLKVKIEEHFKLRDVTPCYLIINSTAKIEEHFKLRDVTPEVEIWDEGT